MEREAEEKDNELEAANRDLEATSNKLYAFEEENERLKEEMSRVREDEAHERDRLEQLAAALKQASVNIRLVLYLADTLTESRLAQG